MLGQVALEEASGEAEILLRQPKRLALLAYLALPRPGTWHRRDTLLSLFWPDVDAARGRTALRNGLYVLRHHLTEGALRTRGDEEVSLDPARFTTDVARLEAALAAGDLPAALALYAGPLLPALYVSGAEPFEKWLDAERDRILGLVRRASVALAEARDAAGDLTGALEAATRAVELDPESELALRHQMDLLDRAGAGTQALLVYERFRSRIHQEFGIEPSAQTIRLAQEIKARPRSTGPASKLQHPVIGPGPESPAHAPAPAPGEGPAVAEPPTLATSAALATLPGLADSSAGARTAPGIGPRLRALVVAIALMLLVFLGVRTLSRTNAAPPAGVLLVLPMENLTGDIELAYLASGVAEDLSTRLQATLGNRHIRSAARADWANAAGDDLTRVGRAFDVGLILRTRLSRDADSLAVSGEVVELGSRQATSIGTLRFSPASVLDLESRLLAAVVGAAFRRPVPEEPRPAARHIDPESYRLTLKGWQYLLVLRDDAAAVQLFTEATRLDPGNARAWAGLSSALAAQTVTWRMPFDEGVTLVEAAAHRALALDSLQGSALANLAIIRGLRERNLALAKPLLARARAAEPANPEIFLIEAALYRHAWRWDKARDAIRIARQLDPLSPLYAERDAALSLCSGQPDAALPLYQAALRLEPSSATSRDGMARALARLGRWDEALATLGIHGLTGEAGYWEFRAREGRPRLSAALEASRTGWVSRARLGTLFIAAGDVERGLDLLEEEARAGDDIGLFRLPCQPDVDRARGLPRFKALLEVVQENLPR